MGELEFDGYLVRARRRAQLSQREMAEEIGVSHSTLANYESGARRVPGRVLSAALAMAGLRLAVLDEAGDEVSAFPSDAVRDNAGRRFPAHLEVQPPDRLPREALRAPRYDRLPPKAWYHLRGADDRARGGDAAVGDDGADHPTDLELAVRLHALRTAGAARLRARRLAQATGTQEQGNND